MKQVFVAADGKSFDSEEDAARYESVMAKSEAITNWVEQHYANKRLTKKHVNVIMEYEAYRNDVMAAVQPQSEAA